MTTPDPLEGDFPSQDWRGQPITAATCASCDHALLRGLGGCEPGRSCMRDVYARRIDRFFRSHPPLAAAHLAHPYFEVRAIAARHADLFHLGALIADPDETVRLQVALRVPQRQLMKLRDDPHREVRIRVAHRIDMPQLAPMLHDPDYQVRCIVARRLPESMLALMMHDSDLQVRLEVARRLPMPALWRLTADPAPEVRRSAAQRLPVALLDAVAADADWTVRWEAAGRATGAVLELPLEAIRALEDRSAGAESLAPADSAFRPVGGPRNGGAAVIVVEQILKFFRVDALAKITDDQLEQARVERGMPSMGSAPAP